MPRGSAGTDAPDRYVRNARALGSGGSATSFFPCQASPGTLKIPLAPHAAEWYHAFKHNAQREGMSVSDPFLPIECMGVVAFAIYGALIAIRKGMDLFGVNVLGLVTAVGGGLMRDLVLGITPPQMLRDPTFALIAIATSTVFFAVLYFYRREPSEKTKARYKLALLYTDAVGLGVFTVSGVDTAMRAYPNGTVFLFLFVALLTGTGGGILRDIMAGETPHVLVKHIYAVASLVGACVYLLLRNIMEAVPATILAAALVVAIRGLASHYRWNFPRISDAGHSPKP